MPIRPENRTRYPSDWRAISHAIRFDRAGGRCECRGECGTPHRGEPADMVRCDARHGLPHPVTGSRVVLTVAHLDHEPEHSEPENLRAMCQRCHLRYDRALHAQTAYMTRRARANTLELPL